MNQNKSVVTMPDGGAVSIQDLREGFNYVDGNALIIDGLETIEENGKKTVKAAIIMGFNKGKGSRFCINGMTAEIEDGRTLSRTEKTIFDGVSDNEITLIENSMKVASEVNWFETPEDLNKAFDTK